MTFGKASTKTERFYIVESLRNHLLFLIKKGSQKSQFKLYAFAGGKKHLNLASMSMPRLRGPLMFGHPDDSTSW